MYGKNRGSAVFLIVTFVGVTYAIAMNTDIDPSRLPAEYNAKGEQHPTAYKADTLKEWVQKNCSKDTYEVVDQVIWYSKYKGVKPEVVFAIGFADSTCATNLTGKNNPGNVGIYKGSFFQYNTMFEGWQAIVDTLNNKYLHKNTMIGQLSPGGRNEIKAKNPCNKPVRGYSCYCSSIENWNTNTKRALSSMLGKNVSANYKIRWLK